jgi:hypothetical protein
MSSMTAEPDKVPDLEVILPQGGVVEVAGIRARVRRLKTREFLTLLRVITSGMGPAISRITLTPDDPEKLQGELIGLFLVAVPNAIDEFAEFLLSIVEAETAKDQPALAKEMVNPDPEVLLDVLTVLAEQEKDDLAVLAGKGKAALARIQSVYRADG